MAIIENTLQGLENFISKTYFKYILLITSLLFCSGIEFIDKYKVWSGSKTLFFIVVPVMLLAVMIKREEFKLDINLIFLFISLWGLISIVWSIDKFTTLKNGILLIGTTIIAIYIGKNYNKKEIFKILLFWFFVLTLGNLFACIFKIGNVYQIDETRYTNVIKGIFKHRNLLGFYMTLSSSISFWFLLNIKNNKALRRNSIITLIGALIMIVWSRSMTSMLLTGLVIAALYLGRYKKFSMVLVYGILPALAFSVYTLVNQPGWFVDFLKAIGRNPTLTGRSFIWEGVLSAISYKPVLGYGLTSFWSVNPYSYYFVIPTYGWIPNHAHNGYLDLVLDFGIIGTVAVLALFPIILNKFRKLAKTKVFDDYKYVIYSIVYIVFILIYNLLESPMVRQCSTVYILLVIFSNIIDRVSKEQKI